MSIDVPEPSRDMLLRTEITNLRRERDSHLIDESDYIDKIMKIIYAARQEPVGDAIEIKVEAEVMQFVLARVKLKPKTIADRLLIQESLVHKWIDGTGDEYDLEIYMWRLKILAHLSRRFNWAVFLLQSKNLVRLRRKR